MNAQKKIERWCRDERFMHYTARRMNEEIADVPENWTYDPEFEELDEAFEYDDRYIAPLVTYLTYKLRPTCCTACVSPGCTETSGDAAAPSGGCSYKWRCWDNTCRYSMLSTPC